MSVILDDQRIIFDKYEKPSNSGYINYHSQHPSTQKRA